MDPKTLFTLLVVTYGGSVHATHGLHGRDECLTARSLALTGMAPEVEAEAAASYDRARKAQDEAWKASHPPRPATEADRKNCVPGPVLMSNAGGCTIDPEGIVRDVPPGTAEFVGPYSPSKGEGVAMIAGRPVVRRAGDAKTAECFPDPFAAE